MADASIITPEIKICGLTDVSEAVACAEYGADAVGLVFFEKSPRNVTIGQARKIGLALPRETSTVGVFVNAPMAFIMERVEACRLEVVQLHGQESPEFVSGLRDRGLSVIKGLYLGSSPFITEADRYPGAAFLVECAKGALPGGNALSWNFEKARDFGKDYPLIIAGGLSPDNVAEAVRDALPDAVDVSSGVESVPGRKDLSKVKMFIEEVGQSLSWENAPVQNRESTDIRKLRRIFRSR